MRIISTNNLADYWTAHPVTKSSLEHWVLVTRKADWRSLSDVISTFPKAKKIAGERARFEIAGGNYRLIAVFHFGAQIVWVKFIGTHAEYDKIDAETVSQF